jgi:hypothetical protein
MVAKQLAIASIHNKVLLSVIKVSSHLLELRAISGCHLNKRETELEVFSFALHQESFGD